MKRDLKFLIKVIRNGFILAGLYFVSVLAAGDLNFQVLKPLIVFFLGYVFTELSKHYGLHIPKNKKAETLIFNF